MDVRSFDLENLADPELSQRQYVVLEGNTTTSFDDGPCDHQKEGSCPRVVESDRDVSFSVEGVRGKASVSFYENRPRVLKSQKNAVTFLCPSGCHTIFGICQG